MVNKFEPYKSTSTNKTRKVMYKSIPLVRRRFNKSVPFSRPKTTENDETLGANVLKWKSSAKSRMTEWRSFCGGAPTECSCGRGAANYIHVMSTCHFHKVHLCHASLGQTWWTFRGGARGGYGARINHRK